MKEGVEQMATIYKRKILSDKVSESILDLEKKYGCRVIVEHDDGGRPSMVVYVRDGLGKLERVNKRFYETRKIDDYFESR